MTFKNFEHFQNGVNLFRELASEYHVAWKEYWPFLKDFADLRCNEGLDKLEEFLKKQCQQKTKTLTALERSFMNLYETVKFSNLFFI